MDFLCKYLFFAVFGESPSGKAPDFDSGIRRFDPYLPSQNFQRYRLVV
jgi:hypothetical protein